jgi:type IV pilus assembly protein PilC
VSKIRLRGKRQRRELIDFCTVLTVQVREGVPLVQALEATGEDCKDPQFREVITGLQTQIESGMEFHDALQHFPGVFTTHFVSVVRAGVTTGKLPETLKDLREYLEWVEQVVGDVRQAALYPAIVMTVVAGFTGFLFTFIIPKFATLLDKLHVQRPLITQIVMGAGNFAAATWWIWVPAFLTLVIGIPLGRRFSPRFALILDRMKLRMPVFGPLNLMLALSRFSHNLAILYQSGIPILEALRQCQQGLIGNKYVEQAVGRVAEDVKTGSTISEALARQPVFSSMLVRMVSLGETTGHLDTTLVTVAEYYSEIIPRRIKALFSVIEPAIMLFIIFLVGIVALAIYLPILSLMGSVR